MNLLFITADHLRADSLGAVQAGREVTPVLNRLAASGTAFERAYTACPLCVPARAALATGLRPSRTGVTWNNWEGVDNPLGITLHERLTATGFALGHAGMDHVRLRPRLRERVPFATWVDETDHQDHLRAKHIDLEAFQASQPFRKRVHETVAGEVLHKEYSTAHVATWPFAAADFRDIFFADHAEVALTQLAAAEKPFALFVNFWAPHPPLFVPPDLMTFFPPDRLTLPPNIGQPATGEPANRRDGIAAQLAADVDEAGWRQAWSAHLALTHLVDALTGRLLAALARTGAANDTLIAFTSDHGDHLGQHAMYQKMELYEQAARVPLIVSGPGLSAGRRVAVPVSLLDVMPTVSELLRLAPAARTDGRSFAAVLRGGPDPAPQPVFTQYTGNNGPSLARHAVIFGDHKLILDRDDGAELYDLSADPWETINRSGDPALAAVEADLRKRLTAWLAAG